MVLPPAIRPDFHSLFSSLLCSRADSTAKKYLKEINKFLLWCRARKIALQLPFSSSVAALYLLHIFITRKYFDVNSVYTKIKQQTRKQSNYP